MSDMMNMKNFSLDDTELSNAAGGRTAAVSSRNIRHAIVLDEIEYRDNVSRSSGVVVKKQKNGVKNTIVKGRKPRLILL